MDILETLRERIREEKEKKTRAIVFWYDATGQESVESLQEALADENVIVRELTDTNFFKLKIEIEIDKPNESFVLYAPFARPRDEENYLLDILLYSTEFKADQIAAWAEQLSVKDIVLRPIVERYRQFFNRKERIQKLKRLLPLNAKDTDVEYGILAVLTGAPIANISAITRYLLMDGLDEQNNEAYKRVAKYFSIERMWELLEQHFGLETRPANRTLRHLMETLLYAHFARDAEINIEKLQTKYPSIRSNICALFIDDWMRGSAEETERLESYIREIESQFELRYYLQNVSVQNIEKVITFPLIDALLIEKVIDELQHKTSDLEAWQERISFRLTTYWGKKERIQALYRVLYEAVRLTEYKTYLKQYDSTIDLYNQYVHCLHYIDQAYRRFMQAYTKLEQREMIESLAKALTNWYENVYLTKLAQETNYYLEKEEQITKIPLQRSFFPQVVQPILEKETTRVFVIISDALRYEIGYELCERLNQRINGEASVSPLYASLPTYTQLGMASLLPHRTLTIDEKKIVYADGEPTNGLANRTKILQKAHPDSVAYRLDEFMDWSRTEAEENFKGKRLVYLYHDVIDATGDSRKSERDTYEAVEKAVYSLELAVDRLSRLQAKRIFITADHGFLFQHLKVEADVKVETVRGTVFDGNRRFAIGHSLTVPDGAVKLKSWQTPLQNVDVVIAKGLNRFMTGGGLQFIHGGAMPQELIIPLIDYRRTEQAKPVDVSVAMLDKVITNYRVPIQFYQEQSVSSDYLPRQLKMAFYQGNERISNEVILTFNLTGENHERTEQVVFTLAERYYPMGETCTLKMETIQDKKIDLYKEEIFTIRMYEALY